MQTVKGAEAGFNFFRATRSELEWRASFQFSKTIDIFDMAYRIFFLFNHMIDTLDEPARPGPAVTPFDALFLRQFKRYKLENFDAMWISVLNCCINFWTRFFFVWNLSVCRVAGVSSFLHTFLPVTQEQLYIFKIKFFSHEVKCQYLSESAYFLFGN